MVQVAANSKFEYSNLFKTLNSLNFEQFETLPKNFVMNFRNETRWHVVVTPFEQLEPFVKAQKL